MPNLSSLLHKKHPTHPTGNKGQAVIKQALAKAQKILGKAELEGAEIIADSKLMTKRLEAQYGEALAKQIEKSQTEFENYLLELKTRSEQAEALTQEFTKQRVNEIFEQFETNLATFLTSTEQKSIAAIDLELKAARQLIDTYKTQQLQLIDENIIAMLEKTLSIVLSKRLTLKDQVDLVYEALEKAKIEKFIA